jgi:hypothetical protein
MSRRRILAVMFGLLAGIAVAFGVFAASGSTIRLYYAAIVGVETVLLAWIAILGWRVVLNRRIAFAVLFGSLAGLAVAVGVWFLLPVTRSAAIVRLQVRNPNPAIGVAAFQKQQIALAKTRIVLNDALQRLDPAILARAQFLVSIEGEPVEELEKHLKIEFVGPELMAMTSVGHGDDADLGIIIGAVAEAYRTQLRGAVKVTLLDAPTVIHGNDFKRRLNYAARAGAVTAWLILLAMLAWWARQSRGPTLELSKA